MREARSPILVPHRPPPRHHPRRVAEHRLPLASHLLLHLGPLPPPPHPCPSPPTSVLRAARLRIAAVRPALLAQPNQLEVIDPAGRSRQDEHPSPTPRRRLIHILTFHPQHLRLRDPPHRTFTTLQPHPPRQPRSPTQSLRHLRSLLLTLHRYLLRTRLAISDRIGRGRPPPRWLRPPRTIRNQVTLCL